MGHENAAERYTGARKAISRCYNGVDDDDDDEDYDVGDGGDDKDEQATCRGVKWR